MLTAFLFISFSTSLPVQASSMSHWVGAWGAAPAFENSEDFFRGTIRQNVQLSIGGDRVRIKIDNSLGKNSLEIGAATIALPGSRPGEITTSSLKKITFSGSHSIILKAGDSALSDPIVFHVNPLSEVQISLFIPRAVGLITTHPLARDTSYISSNNDQTTLASMSDIYTTHQRYFISRIDVDNSHASSLVVLGDSITDGKNSTSGKNSRWPDFLAKRLIKSGYNYGIVNSGIAGNRILHDLPVHQFGPSAISRLDRDVISVPNLSKVIFLEGINDIGLPKFLGLNDQDVTAEEIISGIKKIISKVHENNVKIYGSTLTPFYGAKFPGYFSKKAEEKRIKINHWIRTSRSFDGVIDFDLAIRDSLHPERIKEDFDSGDHLHPNDKGYKEMAYSIPLELFN